MNPALIASVFIVASCGLAYELIMAALASYLLGDSILQFSSIIGVYMFAMGIGAHLTRYIKDKDALYHFVEIEILVGVIGGISALLLFVLFGFSSAPFRSILYALVLIVGIVTGMELPLVMRVLNLRQVEFKEVVSRVLTFDYLGALAVSLLFPLVLAPRLGMARSALLFGILNTIVALFTARLFRPSLPRYQQLRRRSTLVLMLLMGLFVFANQITTKAEQHYFGDPVVFQTASPYQRLVITKWHNDIRLFINGNLQFSSIDEARYHEALVLPVMEQNPSTRNILILGGGDGLAAREILKYPQVEKITLVDLDAAMTKVFRSSAELRRLNKNSLNHPKLQIINADAAQWLEKNQQKYDVIIIDFPDPSNFSLGKLYSVPMYRMVARHLNQHGNIVVQSTSPYFAPHAFWCIAQTLETAGLKILPYHVYVPSFGEWGYVMANTDGHFIIPSQYRVATRYLDADSTKAMFSFPKDMARLHVEPNHLNTQKLVEYFEADWRIAMR